MQIASFVSKPTIRLTCVSSTSIPRCGLLDEPYGKWSGLEVRISSSLFLITMIYCSFTHHYSIVYFLFSPTISMQAKTTVQQPRVETPSTSLLSECLPLLTPTSHQKLSTLQVERYKHWWWANKPMSKSAGCSGRHVSMVSSINHVE